MREVALIAVTGTNRRWQTQLADEVAFWDEYLASKGLDWKTSFASGWIPSYLCSRGSPQSLMHYRDPRCASWMLALAR